MGTFSIYFSPRLSSRAESYTTWSITSMTHPHLVPRPLSNKLIRKKTGKNDYCLAHNHTRNYELHPIKSQYLF